MCTVPLSNSAYRTKIADCCSFVMRAFFSRKTNSYGGGGCGGWRRRLMVQQAFE
jgi:hypothetical protein